VSAAATTSALTVLDTPVAAADWLRSRVRGGHLRADSRAVQPGDGFIAWPGGITDGRRFVADALERGASAALVECAGAESFALAAPQVAAYRGLKADAGRIAQTYYATPAQALRVVAFTGTNGKTSSAWWTSIALSRLKRPALSPCALVGTLGVGLPPHLEATGLTTPDPVLLQQRLRGFVDAGVQACAIEASSIGLAEHRLAGTAIEVAVFTNFTQDHLDYHASMDAYWQAKAALFDWPGLRAAVINLDDPKGEAIAARLQARAMPVWTVARERADARLVARAIRHTSQGMAFEVCEGNLCLALKTRLIGGYNASNLLGVLGALRALGVPLQDAVASCADLPDVPGRMERVGGGAGEPLAIIDYAHTPDALAQALQALRPLSAARGGKLWCVFGCGGERDTGKRPLMGRAAQAGADAVVLTSDNPRGEDPGAILRAIRQGFAQGAAPLHEDADRARAIAWALTRAAAADVVLIAGKGHEIYQDIQGQRVPFSDRTHAAAALARRRGATQEKARAA
jgi:UDP-N-acetylmuramoyl-L-alanyl-D-glutamate--2,6-diaminopimelate ligase